MKANGCIEYHHFNHIIFLLVLRIYRHYGNTHGKSNVLTSGDLTSFMYQVARGMEYLSMKGVSIKWHYIIT